MKQPVSVTRISNWELAVCSLLILWPSWVEGIELKVEEGHVSGRVFESASQSGIANLTVRLTPAKSAKQAEKITTTDQNGEFRFNNLDRGKYLIEVYQGVTLLYRSVLDTRQDSKKVIGLKRKE